MLANRRLREHACNDVEPHRWWRHRRGAHVLERSRWHARCGRASPLRHSLCSTHTEPRRDSRGDRPLHLQRARDRQRHRVVACDDIPARHTLTLNSARAPDAARCALIAREPREPKSTVQTGSAGLRVRGDILLRIVSEHWSDPLEAHVGTELGFVYSRRIGTARDLGSKVAHRGVSTRHRQDCMTIPTANTYPQRAEFRMCSLLSSRLSWKRRNEISSLFSALACAGHWLRRSPCSVHRFRSWPYHDSKNLMFPPTSFPRSASGDITIRKETSFPPNLLSSHQRRRRVWKMRASRETRRRACATL